MFIMHYKCIKCYPAVNQRQLTDSRRLTDDFMDGIHMCTSDAQHFYRAIKKKK